ncbi:MAG: hypothetical protein JKY67_13740 [Pseudomonadales bacterium]|nr:hypothetical protein [Pseudomonadales bacterium]
MDIISLSQNRENSTTHPPFFEGTKPAYLLKVCGDSMQEIGVMDGDLIAVKKASRNLPGDIVLAKLDKSSSIKGLKMINGCYRLAQQQSAPESVLLDSGGLTVKGVFVGLVRGMTFH